MKKMIGKIKNIIWLLKPYWKYGRIYVILSVVVFVLRAPVDDLIYVYYPEIIIELLSKGMEFSYIFTVCVMISGIGLLYSICPKIFSAYFSKKQAQIDLMVNRRIYEKAKGIDYKYVDDPEYYDNFAWALSEYQSQSERAFDWGKNILKNLLSLIVLTTVVMSIGPWVIVIEIIQLSLHNSLFSKSNELEVEMKDEKVPVDRRLSYFHRLFQLKDYAADLKATKLSDFIFTKYDYVGEQKVEISERYARKDAIINIIHEVIGAFTEFIIIVYLAYSIINGNIPEVGMYITMILAYYRIDSKLYELLNLIQEANGISMNAERIQTFFCIESKIETSRNLMEEVIEEGEFSIELKNVGFSYENSQFELSNLNLKINAGQKIAIVGENGAGKSTFVKLLLRLYDVSEGEILINSKNIKDYNVANLRARIGVAFQNTNIYAMTFDENLSLYGEISQERWDRVNEKFDIDSIVKKNGIDRNMELTKEFNKNGVVLSGGETQKIALARVMSRDFGLLLLDEPSSALDPLAEAKMNELILSTANMTTTIMIAHRLSTIRNADKIIVFDKGQIKESGTHDELIKLQGIYYEMFTKQAENYIN